MKGCANAPAVFLSEQRKMVHTGPIAPAHLPEPAFGTTGLPGAHDSVKKQATIPSPYRIPVPCLATLSGEYT